MTVTLICNSDSRGGAAVVSLRLAKALRRRGIDARLLVAHSSSGLPYVKEAAPAWRVKLPFYAECAQIMMHNGMRRSLLFEASTGSFGLPLSKHPWVVEADSVILNWVNQGLLSLSEIARIKAPVYWVMHDMWNATGLCHHAGLCEHYKSSPQSFSSRSERQAGLSGCGSCPLLHGHSPLLAWPDMDAPAKADLSTKVAKAKERLYAAKPITFVAVSNWLAGVCKQSEAMRGISPLVIPNAFPVDEYRTSPTLSRKQCGLPDGRLIVMAAARLDTPVKGLPYAVEALNKLYDSAHSANSDGSNCSDITRSQLSAVFVGDLRDPAALDGLRMPHVRLGHLPADRIADVYAHADVVLSSSLYESWGATLAEGMSAGCVPVTFGQGGQADIVDHLRTGYIARFPDTDDLAQGLQWALDSGIDRETQHAEVARRFSDDVIANRWLQLLMEN